MKKSKKDYYLDVLVLLKELQLEYPSYTLGQHLSTVLDEMGDIWGVSNKDIYDSLHKYKTQLEVYVPRETEIDKIIEDGMNLHTILDND